MSGDAQHEDETRASYGELLGEYFTVVNEISRLLDSFGRPKPEHETRYRVLRKEKRQLRKKLERLEPDTEASDIKLTLDDAFEQRDTQHPADDATRTDTSP